MIFSGRTICPGVALGEALSTQQGVSFFGGVDPDTGIIVERGHELEGQSLAGKILIFPTGKGSTVGSYTLYRLKRGGKAPLAILNAECETITAVGCIIAEIPCLDQLPLGELHTGQRLLVDAAAGTVEVLSAPATPDAPSIPDWLRGREPGSFAEDTMLRRLPEIVRRVAQEGDWPPAVSARLYALADDLPHGRLTPIDDPSAPDAVLWPGYLQPYLGQTWLEAPWFPAEIYLFRRILQITGYYSPGSGQAVDPYAAQKQAALPDAAEALAEWCARLEPLYGAPAPAAAEALTHLLRAAVWGNQADQSIWPAGSQAPEQPPAGEHAAALLVDDASLVGPYLMGRLGPQRVDFVLDNGGLELAYDLLLADFLLHTGLARPVTFHVKLYPTYVSDVTRPDLLEFLAHLHQAADAGVRRLAQRLEQALVDGRFRAQAHPFWVSPLPGWDMPPDLWADLHRADLLISKGDANYRRWLGDRHWPVEIPFARVTAYRPAPLLAMRVLKSDAVAGLAPGQAEALARLDPDWRYNGQWGLIQFSQY